MHWSLFIYTDMAEASEVKGKKFSHDSDENDYTILIPLELLSFCSIEFFIFAAVEIYILKKAD